MTIACDMSHPVNGPSVIPSINKRPIQLSGENPENLLSPSSTFLRANREFAVKSTNAFYFFAAIFFAEQSRCLKPVNR